MTSCLQSALTCKTMVIAWLLLYFAFLHTIHSQLQINLRLTDGVNGGDDQLQHDCLNVAAYQTKESDPRQIVSYCMSELPFKWKIVENSFDQKLTFMELAERSVTSLQLYRWSAPMDVVERYQFYLNQPEHLKAISTGMEVFYNCTLSYFGSQCQYTLKDYKSPYKSLDEFIHHYYFFNQYQPTLFTCYNQLECNRGPAPSCLDWSEICDGKIDCLDGGQDELHCWELEVVQCGENEYHCGAGQCIPLAFLGDDPNIPDCLDVIDENHRLYRSTLRNRLVPIEPTFCYEDVSCVKVNYFSRNPLTSACVQQRQKLLEQAMFSIKDASVHEACWTALKCIVHMPVAWDAHCFELCQDKFCDEIIRTNCSEIVFVPAGPVLAGHIYFGYEKEHSTYHSGRSRPPQYICSSDRLFNLTDDEVRNLLTINNHSCRPYSDLIESTNAIRYAWTQAFVHETQRWLHWRTAWGNNNLVPCNRSGLYQCANSFKCIADSRLMDGIHDCEHGDDEIKTHMDHMCSSQKNVRYFKCETTNECISRHLVKDGQCDCTIYNGIFCDDEDFDAHYARNRISFQTICDGMTHLLPQPIFGHNETDETECEQWECNNVYTRCDGFWNCRNGADEIDCDPSPLLNCSSNSHICVSSQTSKPVCLSIEKANDGTVDCVGGRDEPRFCRFGKYGIEHSTFYCNRTPHDSCIQSSAICDRTPHCAQQEDENACEPSDLVSQGFLGGICYNGVENTGSTTARILCKQFHPILYYWRVYFSLGSIFAMETSEINHESRRIVFNRSDFAAVQYYQPRCHRGLDVQVWLDKRTNTTRSTCLCPPSFFGETCQYQSQRISLTLQFSVSSDSVRTPFVVIVSLIDDRDEGRIHSYEQINYLAIEHCARKFNIYLLYSTRSKNQSLNYSLHIDFYEALSSPLTYRGSSLRRLKFPFLPVHRLAFQLGIPRVGLGVDRCSTQSCEHGRCIRYSSDPSNSTFCQCDSGWSGRHCTFRHTCTCSEDSLCIGILASNRPLCVCPVEKMGSRCLFDNSACLATDRNATCRNGGRCVPIDEYGASSTKSICICPRGFSGDRCEISETKLIISFNPDVLVSSSMRIHYIEVNRGAPPTRSTSFKAMPFIHDSIILYHSFPFHVVFIELFRHEYYLAVVQKTYNQSETIERTIHASDSCVHINTVLNETVASYPLLRRIKYYHLPCGRSSPVIPCFYDEVHLCLCQDFAHRRITNCFDFDHEMNMNCAGKSGCENGGECFQDETICPKTASCACPVCFYGTRCQLSTNGFSLSLDAILGYHVQPKVNFKRQPRAVLISSIITVIITLSGSINGVLSLITFKDRKTRVSGCGWYLLCSSVITLLSMMIFTLKFWILLLLQMETITNRSFMNIQCKLIDFLLRFCLTMDQWLTACVAAERAFITMRRAHFDRAKTKLVAKWIILALAIVTILTTVQDPIYRRLDDEDDDGEQRIWCISDYPYPIRVANLFSIIFHLIAPFVINLVSAIIIITISTRRRVNVQTHRSYKQVLSEQFQAHKNLLIGPTMLIVFAVPRLIISLASGCMRSAKNSWLFLLGYFMSLIPPLGTFILFVLPSTLYNQAFHQAISRYRYMIRRQL